MMIGLTGPTGAGKGAVAAILAAHGFAVLDLDEIAHGIYDDGGDCVHEVEQAFPGVTENGVLNRKALAAIVFSDEKKLELLNQITHKYIIARTQAQLAHYAGQPMVLDAPLLFEAGMEAMCDATVCVVANSGTRRARIMARDGITAAQADARMAAQHDCDWFTARSDYCIVNDASPEELGQRVEEIIKQLETMKQ